MAIVMSCRRVLWKSSKHTTKSLIVTKKHHDRLNRDEFDSFEITR